MWAITNSYSSSGAHMVSEDEQFNKKKKKEKSQITTITAIHLFSAELQVYHNYILYMKKKNPDTVYLN